MSPKLFLKTLPTYSGTCVGCKKTLKPLSKTVRSETDSRKAFLKKLAKFTKNARGFSMKKFGCPPNFF